MKKIFTLFILLIILVSARGQGFQKAEYFFDTDPGVNNGTPIAVSNANDIFNFNASIPTASLPTGFHFLGLRIQHNSGLWSHIEKRGFYVSTSIANAGDITAAEYFFDADPGIGNGTPLSVGTSGGTVNFTAVIPTSLGGGFHFLAIRVKDVNGIWSHYETRGFYISSSTADAGNIVAAEYFFDSDPGIGNGTPLAIGSPGAVVNFTASIPTALSAGFHFIAIRTRNSDGIWGHYEKRGFYISSSTADAGNIVAAEYFFDTDPGPGLATPLTIGSPGSTVNFTATIPTSLSTGFHFLAIRTKNSDGIWGHYEKRGFYISTTTADAGNIVAAEYFFDADPGPGNATPTSIGASGGVVNFTASIPASLTPGFHFLSIRTKNADGIWGHYEKRGFFISTATANMAIITAAEYFYDADPGVGNGTPLTITTPANTVIQTFAVPVPGTMTNGQHFLSIRVKDQNGFWGLYDYDTLNIGVSTITCPANASASTAIGACTAVVNNIDPTVAPSQPFNYTLSGATTGSGNGSASGLAFNVGVTTVTYAVTNSPTVTCSFTVTITGVPLQITTQPVSQTICAGANASFSVTATGTNLNYQWRKNGVDIASATSSTFTITGATASDAGNYTVVVSNSCNPGTTSATAILTVNIPPNITTQPASQVVCTGGNVSFTVAATGTGLTYQWRKGGVNIGSATSSTFTISNVSLADAGNYDVVVTGTCASLVSSVATLTVNVGSAITTQPQSQTVCAGGNVTFTVAATGSGLSYQWRKGGVNIGGATNTSFTINNVSVADAGNYDVVVTASCGNLISNTATLTVNATTAITTQPSALTVCPGASASFSVIAAGNGLTYQWRKGGVNIGGATSSTFTISNVVSGDAGNYDVVVTGTCGNATSNAVSLTVNITTAINTQPQSQTVCAGANVNFSVNAVGTSLTYQWRKNGVNIASANASSLGLTNVSASDVANYDVIVSGACGTVTSSAAALALSPATVITTQPVSQSACAGTSASFTVLATGASLTFQWRKAGVNIGGATAATFTIANVSAADAGNYDVVVTGTCGAVTSLQVSLSINAATAITTQPSALTVCAGTPATFNVAATGTGTITYQWRKNGANITGATASSYSIANTLTTDAGNYDVIVTALCGSVTSSSVALTVNATTAITTQPVSQSACTGGNVTFSVIATGTNLTYQWRKAGVNITGATSSTYTITGVVAGDAGNYDVVVTGTCGTVTSSVAVLTTNAATVIATQPVSQTVCAGTAVSFSVVASGSGTLTYQWRKGGVNIGGATSATYTIASPVLSDAGSYDVVVSGSCGGSVTSSSVSLTVNAVTTITTQPVSQSACTGSNVSFSVIASGTNLTYQWRKGGVNITSATSSNLTLNNVVLADAGNYDVVVTGTCGIVTSSVAVLTLNQTTSISTQPASLVVCAGSPASFSVVASGSALTYQWRKNGTNIGAATSASFTISNVAATDAGNYDVVITGGCGGSLTSTVATLTVNAVTAITTQPVSQSACTGSNVSFSVVASGTNLSYQWRKGGVNIGGATSSTYTINNVILADAGNYDVIVSGTCGNVTSSTAALTINQASAISSQPVAQNVCAGSSVSFTVVASGSSVTYQWRKAGVNISGATSSTYTIANTTTGDAGNYDVVVTGTCGNVTSATVSLSVTAAGTWLGTTSSDWNTASNWCGGVPTSTSDVTIPSTAPNMPNLNAAGTVRNITINNGASVTITTGGTLDLFGNVVAAGNFTATNGNINFRGSSSQSVPAFTVNNMTMNGTGGALFNGNVTVNGVLTLTNGHITLGSNNLTLAGNSTGSIASHVITNGSGSVVLRSVAASTVRTAPVAFNATTYNPAVFTANAGHITDDITVRIGQDVLISGVSGQPFTTKVVDRTWFTSEGVAGGSDVNLSLQWNAPQEKTSFNRSRSYIMQFAGNAWIAGSTTAASGADPFTQTKNNVTSFGPFALQSQLYNLGYYPNPQALGVYPNPTSRQLNIVFELLENSIVTFEFYDAIGRLVIKKSSSLNKGINDVPVDLSRLHGGAYVLKVYTNTLEKLMVTTVMKY